MGSASTEFNDASTASVSWRRMVSGSAPRPPVVRRVQTEHRERLCAGSPQILGQDGRVGQRVAVDLARQRIGNPACRRGVVGGVELRQRLVDVEGAAESLFGRDGLVAEPGQALQHQVHLHLGARCRRGLRFAQQGGQHRRSDAGQHPIRVDHTVPIALAVAHLTVRGDRVNLCARDEFGAMAGCRRCQRTGDRAHAADRARPSRRCRRR